jgi:WD40 repeat protein
VLRGHEESVWGVAFAPDGRLLASGSDDRTVRVWDPVTGQGRVLGRHDGRVYWLQVHPDGRRVGAPDSSGVARIWPLAGGAPVDLRGHHGEVNVLRFSPDGRLAATSSDDGTVRLWETDTGRPVWRAPLLRPGSLELCTHDGWRSLARAGAPRLDPAPAAWRAAVAGQARAVAESAEGHLCLVSHDQALEIWDVAADRRLARVQEPGLEDVVAVPGGCVTLARSRPDPTRARTGPGPARRVDRKGAAHLLLERATAIGWDAQAREILVAGGRQLRVLGPAGEVRRTLPVDVNATAVARVGDHLVVGYRDGNLELLPRAPGAPRPGVELEKVPASPVLRLVAGPEGTVAVGWASGLVALHSLDTGHRLDHVRIHGPVVHLVQHGSRLLAASALGDRTALDLGVFFRPYCELLREVWRRSPVIWEQGLPRLRPAPEGHRCRR